MSELQREGSRDSRESSDVEWDEDTLHEEVVRKSQGGASAIKPTRLYIAAPTRSSSPVAVPVQLRTSFRGNPSGAPA
jgi:hypothetical protein